MTGGGESVGAVVVTYNPDPIRLDRLLASLAPQVGRIVVVDNGSTLSPGHDSKRTVSPDVVEFSYLGINRGIAAAQNAGIERLRQHGCQYVALFDHDSVPSPGMIDTLLAALRALQAQGTMVGAVAPAYTCGDGRGFEGFVRLGWLGVRRVTINMHNEVVDVDFAISSGSLIPIATLDQVGLMDESLFIDHVDTEWCLRARAYGFRHFGVANAVMEHRLGDRQTRFWFGRWRSVPQHTAVRYYYVFRNSLALYRRRSMPLKWKTGDLIRLTKMIIVLALFFDGRRERLAMIGRGLLDGIRNRAGPYMPRSRDERQVG